MAAIHGIGLCCSLGESFAAAADAYLSGTRNFERNDDVVGPDGLPVTLAPVFGFHKIGDFALRLQRLFDAAATDLATQVSAEPVPMKLIVPEWLIDHSIVESLVAHIRRQNKVAVTEIELVSSKSSMAAMELLQALATIGGASRSIVIGVIDSFMHAELLDRLALDGRLLKRGQPHGVVPSEACVLFHVASDDATTRPLGRLRAAWPGFEEADVRRPDGILGRGLAKGFSAAVERGAPDRLMIDLDGERWRSEEIGFVFAAAPVLPDRLEGDFETPPLYAGHCGVATGGLMVALALAATSEEGSADIETTLVSTSQIDGLRITALVERFAHERNLTADVL